MRRNFIKTHYPYPLNAFIATFGSDGIYSVYESNELPDHFETSMNYAIEHIPDSRAREILKLYYKDKKQIFEICSIYNISTSRVTQYLSKSERLLRRMIFLIAHGVDAFIENEKHKDPIKSVDMDIYDADDIRSLKSKLSTKAWRCCTYYADYKSISDLTESFKTGRIMYIRGLGAKTALEIAKAINYDIESDNQYAELLERYYRSIEHESDFKRSFIIRLKTFNKFIESSKINDKDREFAKDELLKLIEKL